MPAVTRRMIVSTLREMGLRAGDIVMAHSSLSSFGRVAGGAKTVVDALLEVVGAKGTLLMPTLTGDAPYNFRTSPSNVGTVTENFRKRAGVLRSLNPCVPACGIGPRADEFLRNHHKCESPYIGSVYDLAANAGGYVLLLGVDQDRNTTLHCAEAYAKATYLTGGERKYVDEKGRVQTYKYVLGAGPHRDFIGVDPMLRAAGIVKLGRVGSCVVRLMKGKEMIDFCVAELKKNPALFITANEGYYGGVMQRGRIRRARLAKEETFKLIVRTGSAGDNLAEVLWQAVRAGASGLEFDILSGLDAAGRDATGHRLERPAVVPGMPRETTGPGSLLRRVEARGLKVSIVRCLAQTAPLFSAAVQTAKELKAEALLCPLTGSPALLSARSKEANAAGLQMLFENVAISCDAVEELMKKLPGAGLAFNPANFVAAGELPFLRSVKPLKKYVRYLAIADRRPLGPPCLPGAGSGEVKELISILRGSSFDGYFSLGAEPHTNFDFAQITDAFYRLLEAC